MVPVPWHDIIEIIVPEGEPNPDKLLTVLGNEVDCPPEKNLVVRAYRLMKASHELPPIEIVLQKIIPDNAGLGGGSADAASTLRLLNEMFNLGLPSQELRGMAATLGADCAFFIEDQPMLCTGIGDVMEPIILPLKGWHLLIAKPQAERVSTRVAYSRVTPQKPLIPLAERLKLPVEEWQRIVKNDFEPSVFAFAPQCAQVKQVMLDMGATYASMTGSGASIFGLFCSDKLSLACRDVLAASCSCFTTLL